MSAEDTSPKKGLTCPTCESFHPYSIYVYSHWNIVLFLECTKCGAHLSVLEGEAKLLKAGNIQKFKRQVRAVMR